jgi:steroid delta-isomerase-like uncharacterized protein
MKRTQTETIRCLIEDVFNRGNLDLASELLHPQYQFASPTESLVGIQAFQQFAAAFREAFPDLYLQIDHLWEGGDHTCLRFTLTGTHRGNLFGLPPTHQAVEVAGVVMSRFEQGTIREEWELLDMHSLYQQLGLS